MLMFVASFMSSAVLCIMSATLHIIYYILKLKYTLKPLKYTIQTIYYIFPKFRWQPCIYFTNFFSVCVQLSKLYVTITLGK